MTLARKAAKLFSRFLFLNPGEVYILFSFVTNGHTSDDFPCRSSLYWELEIFILWRFIALFHVLLSESYEFHSNFLLFWLSGSFASKNGMGIKADLVRHQHFQYITKKNLIACIHINYSFSATFEICSEVYVTGVLYFIFSVWSHWAVGWPLFKVNGWVRFENASAIMQCLKNDKFEKPLWFNYLNIAFN